MKTFINKKTEITFEGKPSGFANLAMIALNTPPQGGWTTDEMRKRIKVLTKLDKQELEAKIELEDAEFDTIHDCTKVLKWQFMHKDIVAFEDYLDEIKKE